jgi:hypothetical protein
MGWIVLGRLKCMQVSHFVPEPSTSEVEVAIGKLKMYMSPDIVQIQAEW